MSKSYGEREQALHFKAARDLYGLAADILDDVVLDTELLGSTFEWAFQRANQTWLRAQALEDRGHEFTVAPTRSENALYKARARYHAAQNLAKIRRQAAQGRAAVEEAAL